MWRIDRKNIFINGLNMFLKGSVPIDDSTLLISEPRDFLLVSSANQRLVIVSNSGISPWNVIGVEGAHQ